MKSRQEMDEMLIKQDYNENQCKWTILLIDGIEDKEDGLE